MITGKIVLKCTKCETQIDVHVSQLLNPKNRIRLVYIPEFSLDDYGQSRRTDLHILKCECGHQERIQS